MAWCVLPTDNLEDMPVSVHAKLRGLYAITDTHLIPRERFVETVEAAVRGGATMVQLREKDTPRDEVIRLGGPCWRSHGATGRC